MNSTKTSASTSPGKSSASSLLIAAVVQTAIVILLAVGLMYLLRGRPAAEQIRQRWAKGGTVTGELFSNEKPPLPPVEPQWPSVDAMLKAAPTVKLVEHAFEFKDRKFTVMAPEGAQISTADGDIKLRLTPTARLEFDFGHHEPELYRKISTMMFTSPKRVAYQDDDVIVIEYEEEGELCFELRANTTCGYFDFNGATDNPGDNYRQRSTKEDCLLALKVIQSLKLNEEVPAEPRAFVEAAGAKVQTNEQGELIEVDFAFVEVGSTLMAKLEHFPELQILKFDESNVSDDDVAVLQKCPKLNYLYTSGYGLSDGMFEHVCQCKNLQELIVNASKVTDHFAAIGNLTKLKRLKLMNIHPPAESSLREIGKCSEIEILGLEAYDFDWSAQNLAFLSNLKLLRELTLEGGVVDGSIAGVALATPVETLYLEQGQITDAGMQHLAQLTNLKKLSLYGWRAISPEHSMQVTGAGLAPLIGLKNLEELTIENSPLDDTAADHLMQMPNLRKIRIAGSKLTDDGLMKFVEMKQLKTLALYDNEALSKDAEEKFREQRKDVGSY